MSILHLYKRSYIISKYSITMLPNHIILLLALLPAIQAAETTLGVFVLHRHGDRTTKAWAPTKLTDLGYRQVYAAGKYFRDKYITGSTAVTGVSEDIVVQRQLNVEAPVDTVLQNSAQAFLQSLYPPVGATLGTQTLANGTEVQAPMNGYQLIPVNIVTSAMNSGMDSENTAWLQGISGCPAAITSSNNYFISSTYSSLLSSTKAFYQRLNPVINGTFNSEYNTFKNAYSIYDLINVATINNATIPSEELLTEDTLFQLRTLADQHEFGLAYNVSDTIRAIAGRTLAAQILEHLNETIEGKSATKFGIQFGAYATFLSFFGLAKLPQVSDNFTGIVDYASSMTFELVTEADVSSGYPSVDNINVRFLFSNGSAAYAGQQSYPLFGQTETVLPYSTFVAEMQKFAVGDVKTWCNVCGVTTGSCAAYASTGTDTGSGLVDSAAEKTKSSSMSLPVAGVIGAMVTLAVVLGLQALVILAGGLKVVSKKRLAAVPSEMAKA